MSTGMTNEEASPYHKEAEKFWDSLTKDQQLQAFYCVTSRIYDAEINNDSSYRKVLYTHFGFGPESYSVGMESGYMGIHNALYDGAAMMEMTKAHRLVVKCDDKEVYTSDPNVLIRYEYNRYKDHDRKVGVINVVPVYE